MHTDRRITDNNALLIQNGYFEEPSSANNGSRPDRPDRYGMPHNTTALQQHLAPFTSLSSSSSSSAARSTSLYPNLLFAQQAHHHPNQQHQQQQHHHHHPHHPHQIAQHTDSYAPTTASHPQSHHQPQHPAPSATTTSTARRTRETVTRTIAIAAHRERPPPVLYEYRLYENSSSSFDENQFSSPLAFAADTYPTPHKPYFNDYATAAASGAHIDQHRRRHGDDDFAAAAGNYLSPTTHQYQRRQPLGQSATTDHHQLQLIYPHSQHQFSTAAAASPTVQHQQQQQQRQQQLYRIYNHHYPNNNPHHIGSSYDKHNQHQRQIITPPAAAAATAADQRHYAAANAAAAAAAATTVAYGAYGYPVKMQCEEVIIEHSQLVSIGNHNNNIINNNAGLSNGGNARPGAAGRWGGSGWASNGFLPANYSTQIVASLAVALGPLAAGLGKGYASPAIASLQELSLRPTTNDTSTVTFTVSDQEASWVASLSLLGALFGGMFGGLAMQYGRRRLLTVMSVPFSLSWILTVFAKSVETMFATAFLGGFCCAIVSMVTQVYISEIASPDIRGFLSAIQKMSGHLGIMISFSLGAYLNWRQLAMLVSVAPMMLFLTVIYIPETPSFLVLKGREQEAYRALQWLRGPHNSVELELETIKANVRATRLSTGRFGAQAITAQNCMSRSSMDVLYANVKAALRNARLVRPILITCGLMVFQRFTGAHAFNFYAVKIFRRTFAGMNPHGGAVSVGFVQLLASMVSGLLIDIVGRIPLLIISSVFMSLALACFGSFVYYSEEANRVAAANFDLDAAAAAAGANSDWIPLLCVLVFTIAFSLGISPISSLLVAELFPLEYRGVGSSIATSFSYFCAFLSVKTFVDFEETLGLHGAFWLYALISCIGLIFVVLFVPETKGKDLEEMDPKYVRTLTINR